MGQTGERFLFLALQWRLHAEQHAASDMVKGIKILELYGMEGLESNGEESRLWFLCAHGNEVGFVFLCSSHPEAFLFCSSAHFVYECALKCGAAWGGPVLANAADVLPFVRLNPGAI